MATFKIFDRLEATGSTTKSFEVWVTDGLLQYVIDGEIRHDISSVSEFLVEAGKFINKGDDSTVLKSNGSVADKAVENFEGTGVAADTNGTNPSISLQDDETEVKIGGSGVGGSLRLDFGIGAAAQAEAASFKAFADDLLGKAQTTHLETLTGVQIGDYSRTVTVSTRDDDVRQISFKSTGDQRDLSWADAFIESLADDMGGEMLKNGNVSDKGYKASQIKLTGDGLNIVDLGSHGIGGKETYEFEDQASAQAFLDAVKDEFQSLGNRKVVVNEAIEAIAADLGGTQVKNGNVSVNYKASQIKLFGEDKNFVTLGSQGVGGKEVYEFDDQETAQEFIDNIRDAFGLEAREGKLVDEFFFKVSGGAGISGSPTFVSKDDFVEFIGDEFGGTQVRNGAVSESFGGGGRKIGDMTDVQLGPKGVGGKEIWSFDDEATADAFIATLEDVFG